MLILPTVLLQHVRREDTHHDWLIAPPPGRQPHAMLWAARAERPSSHWGECRRFLLTALPPHRRRYLTYQGPISAGRGAVRRVDRGHVIPLRWTQSHLVLDTHFEYFTGRIHLTRLTPTRWRARVENPCITGG